jgi:hypothetical protein
MPSISIFQAGLARPPTIRVLAGLRSPSALLRASRAAAASPPFGSMVVISDEVVQGHPGSLQLCFEILPSKAALLGDVVGDCAVQSSGRLGR